MKWQVLHLKTAINHWQQFVGWISTVSLTKCNKFFAANLIRLMLTTLSSFALFCTHLFVNTWNIWFIHTCTCSFWLVLLLKLFCRSGAHPPPPHFVWAVVDIDNGCHSRHTCKECVIIHAHFIRHCPRSKNSYHVETTHILCSYSYRTGVIPLFWRTRQLPKHQNSIETITSKFYYICTRLSQAIVV